MAQGQGLYKGTLCQEEARMETAVIERAFSQREAAWVTHPLHLGLGERFTVMPCSTKRETGCLCAGLGAGRILFSGDVEGLDSQASSSAENSESSLGRFVEQNCQVRSHIYDAEDGA